MTASSKGIGAGIAKGLHAAGAKVALCARDKAALEATAASLEKARPKTVFTLTGDIGDPAFLSKLVEGTERALGGSIQILINNSGGPAPGGALEMTEDQWQSAIARNLMSVIRLSGLVVPGMKKQKWGRIINLTSMTAKEPDAGLVLSNVTRVGVGAYAKTLANEVGPFGITVNTILTGGVLTDRLRSLVEKGLPGSGKNLQQAIDEIAKTIPVRHIATPEEFAQFVTFLASEESGYLNGTSIPLDGGAGKSL